VKYPRRGEVWLIDLGMAAKVRPAVVVSTAIGDQDRALITILPHTTSTRGTAWEVTTAIPFLKPGAFDAQGIVTVPAARAIRLLGTLTREQMRRVEEAIAGWLELPLAGRGEERS
jgi:mRNA interferase MazF